MLVSVRSREEDTQESGLPLQLHFYSAFPDALWKTYEKYF